MPTTFADRVPTWARPYVPISSYSNESFSVVPRLVTLTESTQSQTVQGEFSVKFVAASPNVSSKKELIDIGKPSVPASALYLNTIIVNKSIGFFGVRIDAKNYKREEVQYMRRFPTDSFPLGIISLDKSGRSIYSHKLQYGKQIVIAPQVMQLLTVVSQLGQLGIYEELVALTLDAVYGRIYYDEILVDVSFLTVYQSCVMTFNSAG
jgi:hypothetical protein